MPVSCGTDMVEVARIRKAADSRGAHFLTRLFTPGEIAYCTSRHGDGKWLSFAARFAAKEAVAKALGTGFSGGVTPKDIEITLEPAGKPEALLTGGAAARFAALHGESLSVSLSHTDTHAIAMAVMSYTQKEDASWTEK